MIGIIYNRVCSYFYLKKKNLKKKNKKKKKKTLGKL